MLVKSYILNKIKTYIWAAKIKKRLFWFFIFHIHFHSAAKDNDSPILLILN